MYIYIYNAYIYIYTYITYTCIDIYIYVYVHPACSKAWTKFKGNWFHLKVIAVRESVGLNSWGCLDANPKQTCWSLGFLDLENSIHVVCFWHYDKSTCLSIASFAEKTSACEGCKMQWFNSWLDCNDWPRLAPAGQARRGSSATLARQESKMQCGRKGQKTWLIL